MAVSDLADVQERPAFVRFEQRAFEDKPASLIAGMSVSKDVDMVFVTPPYTKEVYEFKWETWIANQERNAKNNRVPREFVDHWKKMYAAFKQGQEAPLNGSPIKDWSAISPAQCKNLIAMRILTIEDLAACNAEGMKRIGMGARDLVTKAKNWLRSTQDHGAVTFEITQLQNENEQLKAENLTLREQNAVLRNQVDNNIAPSMAEPMREPVNEITANDLLEEDPLTAHNTKVVAIKIKRDEFKGETIDKLFFLYKEKFGKRPHPSIKRDKLIEKLLE